MNINLDWLNFDGTKFQKLCNSLVYFHVSKHAEVYSAEGKDGGIDQYFIGQFGDKLGKWRFQDKFRSGDHAFNNLKSAVQQDIRNCFSGEDFIVFLTNLNLLPQEHAKLEEIARAELAKLSGEKTEVEIWHESSIETILIKYPFIREYFWTSQNSILETYENYFASKLDPTNVHKRDQLSNFYVKKEPIMNYLENFILNREENILTIHAPSGYGKTRTIIEFFKTLIEGKQDFDNYYPLVLTKLPDLFILIKQLLNSEKKYILLLDNFKIEQNQSAVLEFLRYINNENNRIKLIITVEDSNLDSLKQITVKEKLKALNNELFTLTLSETRWLVQSEIPNINIGQCNLINEISQGNPFVILECCRAVKKGIPMEQLAQYQGFNEFISAEIEQTIVAVAKKTDIPKYDVEEIINLITLISPIKRTEESILLLSEVTQIRFRLVEKIIEELLNVNFLSLKNRDFTIQLCVPAYTNAILRQFIQTNRSGLPKLFSNVILLPYLSCMLINLKGSIISSEFEKLIENIDEKNCADFLQLYNPKNVGKFLSELSESNKPKAAKILDQIPNSFINSLFKSLDIVDIGRTIFELNKIDSARVFSLFEANFNEIYIKSVLNAIEKPVDLMTFLNLVQKIAPEELKPKTKEVIDSLANEKILNIISDAEIWEIGDVLAGIASFSPVKAYRVFKEMDENVLLDRIYKLHLGIVIKPLGQFYKIDQVKGKRILSAYDNHSFIKQAIKIQVKLNLICNFLDELREIAPQKIESLYKNLSTQRVFQSRINETYLPDLIKCYTRLYRVSPKISERIILTHIKNRGTVEIKEVGIKINSLISSLNELANIDEIHRKLAVDIFHVFKYKYKYDLKSMKFIQITANLMQLSSIDVSLPTLVFDLLSYDEWLQLVKETKSLEVKNQGIIELAKVNLELAEKIRSEFVY